MDNHNENTSEAFRGHGYEKPDLELIAIVLEGSFLDSVSNHSDFGDRVSVDDDELADEFD